MLGRTWHPLYGYLNKNDGNISIIRHL